jgi:hypothetical protein
MNEAERCRRYTIRVTHRDGVHELRIPELLLTVKAGGLQEGYERLLERQRELVDLARSMDALDELPPPAETPALKSIFR